VLESDNETQESWYTYEATWWVVHIKRGGDWACGIVLNSREGHMLWLSSRNVEEDAERMSEQQFFCVGLWQTFYIDSI